MTVCLTTLEVAHVIFLGKWNSEVFAAITGLSGTVIGIFMGQKA
jgi:tetrahydromethanopterin S-methyltransferase subunit E